MAAMKRVDAMAARGTIMLRMLRTLPRWKTSRQGPRRALQSGLASVKSARQLLRKQATDVR